MNARVFVKCYDSVVYCLFSPDLLLFLAWCSGDRFVYDEANGKCYKAWTTELSWSDAQTVCQQEGGTLAILDTDTKIDLMASIPGMSH